MYSQPAVGWYDKEPPNLYLGREDVETLTSLGRSWWWLGKSSQGESAVYENKSIEIVRNHHHHPYKLHSCCNIFLGRGRRGRWRPKANQRHNVDIQWHCCTEEALQFIYSVSDCDFNSRRSRSNASPAAARGPCQLVYMWVRDVQLSCNFFDASVSLLKLLLFFRGCFQFNS